MTRRIAIDNPRFIADVERTARARGMTLSGMCLQIGVQYATVSRMHKHGSGADAASLCAMAQWAGIDPREYLIDREAEELTL